MMTLSEFRKGLESYLDLDNTLSRPFVCDRSPFDAPIFIVGYNPARTLQKPFSGYWSDHCGFKKQQWIADFYEEHPRAPTRKIIERIVAAAKMNALDTNVFWYPTRQKSHLRRADQITAGFEFLMDTLGPKVVFAYSKKPVEFFRVDYRRLRETNEIFWEPRKWQTSEYCLVCWAKHLRSTSYVEADLIGKKLAQLARMRR
jgi:hypothetical protein